MADLKYCNYCDNCEGHRTVETYYWETEEALNNQNVLGDFIRYQMPEGWSLVNVYRPALSLGMVDYAEVADKTGKHYHVDVIDTGDTRKHKVDIISIAGDV